MDDSDSYSTAQFFQIAPEMHTSAFFEENGVAMKSQSLKKNNAKKEEK